MSKYRFKEGDIVIHKSNTAFKMVVNCVDEDELKDDENYPGFECTWLDSRGVYHCEEFCEFELERSLSL